MEKIEEKSTKSNPSSIENEEGYRKELADIESLFQAEEGTPEMARLLVLVDRIDAYENLHYPIATPEPVEAIKFRMEQANLKQRDLIPCIGSRKMVSEVFSGKRPITPEIAHSLNERFGIPLVSLLQASPKQV